MLNIVVPMAGAGSRFVRGGYADPKPLIPLHGKPMIQVVIGNLTPSRPHRFIFICQQRHVEAYGLRGKLDCWAKSSVIVGLNGLTDGAARSVLAARDIINNDEALMIANSDQFVDVNIDDYLAAQDEHQLDGIIMTMRADDPKWSFVGLGPNRQVTTVAEKTVISNEATVGIYNFRRGRDFVSAAGAMIDAGRSVNGEFYVAPAYNELIAVGAAIGTYNIGAEGAGMYGLGIPADLQRFLALPACDRALASAARLEE